MSKKQELSSKQELLAIASGYYFMMFKADEDAEQGFGIAERKFWDENHKFDDCYTGDERLFQVLPRGFENASESEWYYHGNREEGRLQLVEAGFEQLENVFGW